MKIFHTLGWVSLFSFCALSLSSVDIELGSSANADKVSIEFPRFAPVVTLEYASK